MSTVPRSLGSERPSAPPSIPTPAVDSDSGQAPEPAFEEQFPYGWRYIRHKRSDGSIDFEQVPLTLLDALHPRMDDEIPSNYTQLELVRLISNAIEVTVPRRGDVLVLNDVLTDWGVPGIKAMAPDITVLFGAKPDRSIQTYKVPKEGVTTEVVIEITSPSTRVLDVENKVDLFFRCGISRYVIVDVKRERVTNQLRSIELVDYRAGESGYVAQPWDPSEMVWLESLRLGLVVEGTTIRCVDEHGQTINAEFVEQFRAREQAEQQAREQSLAREQAEQQAREQSLAREQAEREAREQSLAREQAERQAREQTLAREQAERQAREQTLAREQAESKAREEAQARLDAEERIRKLEEALSQARGES